MRASPIAIFVAGFIAGGIALGGVLAHARIVVLNGSIAGVLPNSGGSLFCSTAASAVRPIKGVSRDVSVATSGGGVSWGIELKCPS